MAQNITIGFIGYGNMAQAIAQGLVDAGVVNGGEFVSVEATGEVTEPQLRVHGSELFDEDPRLHAVDLGHLDARIGDGAAGRVRVQVDHRDVGNDADPLGLGGADDRDASLVHAGRRHVSSSSRG